jgi:hypothetical protein
MGALALFLVIAGGTAYAANTVFSSDIVNGEVKSVDIATGGVQSADVKNQGLTGADIADQSGVDTCPVTARIGDLCFRAEDFARSWTEAASHCANLDLRLPTLAEALTLARGNDLPGVDENEFFWTDDHMAPTLVGAVADGGGVTAADPDGLQETACVTTPTN